MNNKLEELFLNHKGKVSDKWSLYTKVWDNIFSPLKEKEINILEIGIQNGGSLEIWAKYFLNAKNIIGCDNEKLCRFLNFSDPRISIVLGNINEITTQEKILKIAPKLDIIIDDGSHKSDDVIRTFARYFNVLNYNGLYVIEDLHTSYWKNYGGGLSYPYSAMSFLKRLADIINHEHWENSQQRLDYISPYVEKYKFDVNKLDLAELHSINFLNSLCIIQKQVSTNNTLGKRLVVGTEEKVTKNWQNLYGSSMEGREKISSINEDTKFDVISLIHQNKELFDENKSKLYEIKLKSNEIKLKNQEILILKNELEKCKKEVLFYASSKSWRITRPLRKLMKFIKGIL